MTKQQKARAANTGSPKTFEGFCKMLNSMNPAVPATIDQALREDAIRCAADRERRAQELVTVVNNVFLLAARSGIGDVRSEIYQLFLDRDRNPPLGTREPIGFAEAAEVAAAIDRSGLTFLECRKIVTGAIAEAAALAKVDESRG
jgi:hypothetical protein